ncbi:MAG: ferritin [Candidatus Hydrogenedentes bacterium]|nr:ferritin [Candidatus Hydrogenedentota bacterium]
MISSSLEKALNKHLNLELYSAYVYAAMAAYFDSKNLKGFASWMKIQTGEEMAHAQKFYAYINDVGGRVVLDAIDKPADDYKSPSAAFKTALDHERKVTKAIYKLVDLAQGESHHATTTFLQWFVTEQVEEEAVADDIVKRLSMIGESPEGLFLMDRELGARQAAGSAGSSTAK